MKNVEKKSKNKLWKRFLIPKVCKEYRVHTSSSFGKKYLDKKILSKFRLDNYTCNDA